MKSIKFFLLISICYSSMNAQEFVVDKLETPKGELSITLIGHATLMMQYNGKIIHIDPVSREVNYDNMPKADLILVTHQHGDHLDFNAISKLTKENTTIIGTESCKNAMENTKMETMQNGDRKDVIGLTVIAVPAYNVENKRPGGNPYHPKGEGNGYVISLDGYNVYIAGDTENTKEMKALKNIDVAFLPMNLPYTMTAEMVADAVKAFKPKILYPYHYNQSFLEDLKGLLKDEKDIELRIREM